MKKESVEEIRDKGDKFLNNRKNANNVVELLELLQDDENEAKFVLASMKAILKIFSHLLSADKMVVAGAKPDGKVVKPSLGEDDEADKEEEYRRWLQDRYSDSIKCICDLIQSDSEKQQTLSLTTTMKLIQLECNHPLKATEQQGTYHFPTVKLKNVLNKLVSRTTDMKALIGRFQEYLEYDDVRYEVLVQLTSLIKAQMQGLPQQADLATFCENCISILELVTMPTSETHNQNFLGRKPTTQFSGSTIKDHKRVFTNTWLLFLRLPLPTSVYKRVLIIIHDKVMPYITTPLLLTDFLTASYDIGGAISLLALQGLFFLISQYNLEYPEFYKKLYGLLEPSIFHARYQARFFHLTDLFLTSTHIPAYLVAAFAKRLSRLSLTAPPAALEMLIPFICNLLMRHTTCQVLVHNTEGPKDISSDPYIMAETDPSKSHAMESSLWEIHTLKSHYHPGVATAAALIDKPFPKLEFEVADKFELTTEELITKEVKKKQKTIALEYKTPDGLFGGNDGDCFSTSYWQTA